MLRYTTNFISLLTLTGLFYYGILVFGLAYIELTYAFGILPEPKSIVASMLGTRIVEKEAKRYCHSKNAGNLLPYDPELNKICSSDSVHRVYIYSRIIRKSWSYFVTEKGIVVKQNAWVTM
jgi:hypothetical protein